MKTAIHEGWLVAEAVSYLEAHGFGYETYRPANIYIYRGRNGEEATIKRLPPTGKCVLTIREGEK